MATQAQIDALLDEALLRHPNELMNLQTQNWWSSKPLDVRQGAYQQMQQIFSSAQGLADYAYSRAIQNVQQYSWWSGSQYKQEAWNIILQKQATAKAQQTKPTAVTGAVTASKPPTKPTAIGTAAETTVTVPTAGAPPIRSRVEIGTPSQFAEMTPSTTPAATAAKATTQDIVIPEFTRNKQSPVRNYH